MAGRYLVLDVLGCGATAHVCLARRLSDGPDHPAIALKVLRPDLPGGGQITRRFRDEHRMLSRISHPAIVQVYDLFDYNGRLVLEMERVRGVSIDDAMGFDGQVPIGAALAVVREIVGALQAAQDAPDENGEPMRLVHRDLKPGNVAIDVGGRVVLLDFGVAKGTFDGRSAQSLHDVWGTLGYDAPERKEGINHLPSGDIYSLGVTLFVMLTQHPMLLSLKKERHDDDVDAVLRHLPRVGVDNERITSLIRAMLLHDYERRPLGSQVVEMIDAIQVASAGRVALAAYGASVIDGMLSNRVKIQPSRHRSWPSLRFLQEVSPTPPAASLSRAESTAQLAKILALPDWEKRDEIERVLRSAEAVDLAVFVAIVGRAQVSAWQVWRTPARPGEVEAALLVINRFDYPLARRLAATLLKHPDARVAKVARFVVKQGA